MVTTSSLIFAVQHEVPFDLCGKIIVATEEKELPVLKTIFESGQANGLKNLKMLKAEELKEYEPHVAGIAGIHVPQTGIVDYRVVAEKYAEVFQRQGGELRLGEKVIDIQLGKRQGGCSDSEVQLHR